MESHPRILLPGEDILKRAAGRPIRLEVGAGKGGFILAMAAAHPDIYFLGMERQASALVFAIKHLEKQEESPENLDYFYGDAEQIEDCFPQGCLERLYLNFSDPWPKKRHEGRRLPGRKYLERFKRLLIPGGGLEFKTDNQELFSFALEELEVAGFKLISATGNLYAEPALLKENIPTEYEKKFVEKGVPICRLEAVTSPI